MKINIDLSKTACDHILERFNYVSEIVILYYNPIPDFGNDFVQVKELRGLQKKVCYPMGDRPEVLSEEQPLLEDCEDIL